MKKKLFSILTLNLLFLALFYRETFAVCPVCTAAVGAGLGLSRYLGIDDAVSSIWIGGLLVSLSFWTIDWTEKKKPRFLQKFNKPQVIFSSFSFWYILTFLTLQATNLIGHPLNKIFGIDKIIFGTTVGSLAFLGAYFLDKKVRKIKGGQLFSYQKVVFPLVSLVLTSFIIYYLLQIFP